MKKILISIVSVSIITTCFVTLYATHTFAQTSNVPDNSNASYTLLEPLPNLEGGGVVTTVQFKDYVQYFFNLVIALSAAAAVFMIVFGGFQYMTTDSWEGKSEGITKVKNAVLGLLLVLSSYLLLRTIDPRLVEIPSTLVKPLQIKYSQQKDAFLQTIDNYANQYKIENLKLMDGIYSANQKIGEINKEQQGILDELSMAMGETVDATKIADLCSRDDVYDYPELADACMGYYSLEQEKTDAKAKVFYSQAVGTFNSQIIRCLGANNQKATTLNMLNYDSGTDLGAAECLDDIKKAKTTYLKELNALGDVESAKYVEDYAYYASQMVYINQQILGNMAQDPTAKALVDSIQTAVGGAGIIGGAAVGGGVGAVGGFATAEVFNGYINNIVTNENRKNAEVAVNAITNKANIAKTKISTPEIKQQFVAQTNALLKSLGGKPISE